MEIRDTDHVNSSGQMLLYTMMLKMLLDQSQITLENINMVFPELRVECSNTKVMGSIPREIKNSLNVNEYIECSVILCAKAINVNEHHILNNLVKFMPVWEQKTLTFL